LFIVVKVVFKKMTIQRAALSTVQPFFNLYYLTSSKLTINNNKTKKTHHYLYSYFTDIQLFTNKYFLFYLSFFSPSKGKTLKLNILYFYKI